MTAVSLNFRQSAFAQETGRVPICLITLTHDSLPEPIRLSTDPTQRMHFKNLVHNGSGELGNAQGWQAGFDVDEEGLVMTGGATIGQHPTYRMSVDISQSYDISLEGKIEGDGSSINVWLLCEDDISIAGGNGSSVRDRSNWTPTRNTTLSESAAAGSSSVKINAPSSAWTTPGTHTMMLFGVPEEDDPDPNEIAAEGHVISAIDDLGGGIWEITLSTTLRQNWPAGTLVSNGTRTTTNNGPRLFGGNITPGADWGAYSAVHYSADPLGDPSPPQTRTTFRRGTKYVRMQFSGVESGDSLHLRNVRMIRTGSVDESMLDVVYGTHSRGETYYFLPMTLKLPDDTDSGAGEMIIEMDNVHRTYTQAIRSIADPVKFNVEIVMDNSLDTVEAQWPEYLMTHVVYDASTIRATLKVESLDSEPFPSGSFNPSYFPGLF